jgi:hypothetical protein
VYALGFFSDASLSPSLADQGRVWLMQLADGSGGLYFEVGKPHDFKNAFDAILDSLHDSLTANWKSDFSKEKVYVKVMAQTEVKGDTLMDSAIRSFTFQ